LLIEQKLLILKELGGKMSTLWITQYKLSDTMALTKTEVI